MSAGGDVGLALVVSALTAAETVVSTWENRADRQVGPPGTEHFARRAALWAGVFEGLLYAGMYLVVQEAPWLIVPGVVSATASKWWAGKQRIKKWKSRKKRKQPKAARSAAPNAAPAENTQP